MKDNREKVVIRKEYDPYMKIWKYLCIFPEYYEGYGMYGCVAVWKTSDGIWMHDCYGAGPIEYFYKCKIIHKNSPEAIEIVTALKKFYGDDYKVVEKIIRH